MTHIPFNPLDKYLTFEELDTKYPNRMWIYFDDGKKILEFLLILGDVFSLKSLEMIT